MILSSVAAPTLYASLAAAVVYALPVLAAARLSHQAIRRALMLAWLLHGLALGMGLMGEPALFGFAPALSATVWLVLTVYGIETIRIPELRVLGGLAGLGAAAVMVALAFPGTPVSTTGSPWLPLHWALGIASYGMFATALVHAWLMNRAEQQMRQTQPGADNPGVPLLTLERLTFRFVQAGFVLLSATLLAGHLFGEALYGSKGAWKWDHKTVFSLLSWLTFAALLLGRRRFGWRGRTAVRVLYSGSALLLLAYAGSRFVLEVVLGRTP